MPKNPPRQRQGRDFDRQRPRDPAETDSAAERMGFEPLVPPVNGLQFLARIRRPV